MTTTTPVEPRVRTEPRGARHRRSAGRLAPLLPAALLLAVFFLGPVLWSVYAAFTDAALTGPTARDANFVGLRNFTRLFGDDRFAWAIWATVIFAVASGIVGQNGLGLTLALLLRGRARWLRNVIGVLLVGAWVLPEIVAGFTLYAFFTADGSLDAVLTGLHLPSPDWLVEHPMLTVVLANIWRGTAFSWMVYTAALDEIPQEIEDAAATDGADGWRQLVFVTLPLIRRAMLTNLMVVTLQTLAVFTLIFVLTGGGPSGATETVPLYMYQQAFRFFQLGQGTAIALVLLAIGGLFSLLYLRVLKPEVD
ncbi:ABC transporter permease subunit [Streptomyces sp. 3MP-14]|uniref:ABC transporter permease subunit n=1 Tax=Streptomyces mimosae TaxID=2586635 RepID=A0A5N6ABW2_9ACTN|nr:MULTISPECIES: sugar ABC transporter permease [Streptomyces]KAB8166317.1 ABC transporter permease subunit [Streptomyces mimosae]KAB8174110.1 ABC transporter permease subunit [Streptomyces sp. 3MP-14]